jgi:hypothetical protein
MRPRLKVSGSTASPTIALEHLRRLQQHRVQIGSQQLAGIGKATTTQLELFEAIGIQKPENATVESHFLLFRCKQIKHLHD